MDAGIGAKGWRQHNTQFEMKNFIQTKKITLLSASLLVLQLSFGADQLLNLPLPADGKRYETNAEMAPQWPSTHGQGHIAFWGDDKHSAVSITIDDNNVGDNAFWSQQANLRGWKFTWFIIVHPYMWDIYNDVPGNNTSYFGTAQDFKVLYDDGHEIELHGNCDINSLNAADYREHLLLSRAYLESEIGHEITTYAYPCSEWGAGDIYRGVAEDLFISARGGIGGGPNKNAVIDYLGVQSMGNGTNQSFWDKLDQQPANVQYSAYRGWAVLLWHNLKTASDEQQVIDLFDWIESNEHKYWVKPYGHVARYAQQRESGTINVQSVNATEIKFSLTDRMDDSIFDIPLTVKFRTDGWESVQATQGGALIDARIVTHQGAKYTIVEAVPDRGQVRIWTTSAPGGGAVPLGVVTIRNREYNQYLDTDSNGAVDLNNTATGADRQWDIIPVGDGVHYWIDNMQTGRNNLYFDSGPNDVRYWDNHYNGDWTKWKIESVGGGYFVLTNKADGGKLDGDSGNNVDLSYVGNDRHDVQWSIETVSSSDVGVTISATLFDAESHPGDDNRIRIASSGENIGWIKDGNWIRFYNFDFGSGASACTVEASSGGSGGRIEFRLGSATGTLIGSITVTSNGNWGDYRTLSTNSITNESNGDLYLVFKKINNNNGDLMNLKSFKFE